jgi:hypothetical protein
VETATKEQALAALKHAPPVGSEWTHAKTGKRYTVVRLSILEATLEPAVTYRAQYDGVEWTRTLATFRQLVNIDGVDMPRFLPAEPTRMELALCSECAGGGCIYCGMRGGLARSAQ